MTRKDIILYENIEYKNEFVNATIYDNNIWIITSNIKNSLCIYNYDTLNNEIIYSQKIPILCSYATIIMNNGMPFLLCVNFMNLLIYIFNGKFIITDILKEKSSISKVYGFVIDDMPTYVVDTVSGTRIYDSKNIHLEHLPQINTNHIAVQKNKSIYIYQYEKIYLQFIIILIRN
jgi:hypothetical protein